MRFAIDLQPDSEKIVRFPAWTWAVVGVLILSLVGHGAYKKVNHSDPTIEVATRLEALVKEKELLLSSMGPNDTSGRGLAESRKIAFLNSVVSRNSFDTFNLFLTAEGAFDNGMVVEKISVKEKNVTISGFAKSLDDIYMANNRLTDSQIFKDVRMSHRTLTEEEIREMGRGILKFTFQMKI